MRRCLTVLCFVLLLAWFNVRLQGQADTPLSITNTPSIAERVAGTQMALAPLEITFDGVYSLALEFRAPLRAALEANRNLLNGGRYTVSAYRDIPGWAKITLVPTAVVENAWAEIESVSPVEVIMRQSQDKTWVGCVIGSPDFMVMADDLPRTFVDTVSPLPALESDYKFPWQTGQDWWAIQGWHDGSALDFEPAISARFAVLAAQAGRLREICSDGTQSLLQIQHADGRSTYYLHVTLGLAVRRHLLDQVIRQGQYLGELIMQAYFVTPCGQGYSRHLHFAVSDRAMSIEGVAIEDIAASASCCQHPPTYRSTNVRVDDSGG
ncbi:MAG: M23 family metallopeptidase [Chloroflexota bacterium]